MKQRILGIPPHLSLILSLILLTCSITDRFNSAMAFINHPLTKGLILVLAIINLLSAMRMTCLTNRRTRSLRLLCSGLWGLPSVAAIVIFRFDYSFPERILFTNEGVKLLLFALAILSIVLALLLIVLQRKETAANFPEEAQV